MPCVGHGRLDLGVQVINGLAILSVMAMCTDYFKACELPTWQEKDSVLSHPSPTCLCSKG